MPNTDTALSWQTYEVHNVTISSDVQPEVRKFTFDGGIIANNELLTLKIVRGSAAAGWDIQSHNITYGCTAD